MGKYLPQVHPDLGHCQSSIKKNLDGPGTPVALVASDRFAGQQLTGEDLRFATGFDDRTGTVRVVGQGDFVSRRCVDHTENDIVDVNQNDPASRLGNWSAHKRLNGSGKSACANWISSGSKQNQASEKDVFILHGRKVPGRPPF